MLKAPRESLNLLIRAHILKRLLNGESLEQVYPRLTVYQLQELRDFLQEEVVYLSSMKDDPPLTVADIKERYEPIPNYYYRQDCREPLDSCYNETCLTSNPICFSKKMKGQLAELVKLLQQYLPIKGGNDQSR
ncbi:MAG: hypothetical protein GXO78_00325 [Calditrichaeota bacterium]|nr:hypothetical protein [Calditrichota bacterium]